MERVNPHGQEVVKPLDIRARISAPCPVERILTVDPDCKRSHHA